MYIINMEVLPASLKQPQFAQPIPKFEYISTKDDQGLQVSEPLNQRNGENHIIQKSKVITRKRNERNQNLGLNDAGNNSKSELRESTKIQKQTLFQNTVFFELEAFDQAQLVLFSYRTSPKHSFQLEYSYVLDTVQNSQELISQIQQLTFCQKLKCIQYFRIGNRYLSNKNFLSASQSFKHAIKTFQLFHSCYNNLAYIQYIQNHRASAIKYLQQALLLNPENANLWNNLALQYVDSDVDRALQHFSLSIKKQVTYTALTSLATLYFQLADYKLAETYFQESLRTQKTERAALGIAVTYCLMEDRANSENYFEQALNNNRQSKMVLLHLGNAYMHRQNYQLALAQFKTGSELYPEQPEFLNGIGNYHINKKDFEKSRLYFNKAIQIKNDGRYHTNIIASFIKSEKVDQAIQHLYRVLQSDQVEGTINMVDFIDLLSQKLTKQRVISILNRVIQQQTKQPKFFYMLLNQKALLHSQVGDYEQSLRCLRLAEKLRPDPKIMLNIAILMYKMKKIKQSFQYLEQLIERHVDFAEAYYYLGAFYAYQKKYQKALVYFSICKSHNQSDPKVYNALGVMHFYLKDYRQSYNCITKSLNLNPLYVPARNNLSLIPYVDNRDFQKTNQIFIGWNNFPSAFFNKANQLVEEKEYEKAQQLYRIALRCINRQDEVYHNLGLVQIRRGNSKQGVRSLKKAVMKNYQSYQSCIMFTMHSENCNSEKHLTKLMKKMKDLKQQNFKIHLNIAVMSKIMKEKLEYVKYLQLSFSHFIQDGQFRISINQAADGVKYYQQVRDFIDKTCKQFQFSDIDLMLGLLYQKVGQQFQAQKIAMSYLKNLKLKRESLFDILMRRIKTDIVYYSQTTQNDIINYLVASILKQDEQLGTLCYFKIKSIFPLFYFEEPLKEKIQERRHKLLLQAQYFLSIVISNRVEKIKDFQQTNSSIQMVESVLRTLPNSSSSEIEEAQVLLQRFTLAFKKLLSMNRIVKFDGPRKLKKYYKRYRQQTFKLKQIFSEFINNPIKKRQQLNKNLYNEMRTKLLQMELSKFIHNKLLIYQFYSKQKEILNKALIRIMQGHYNNNFGFAFKDLFNQMSQQSQQIVQGSSLQSFSNHEPQIYGQNQIQSKINSQKINQSLSISPQKAEKLLKILRQAKFSEKKQRDKDYNSLLKKIKAEELKKIVKQTRFNQSTGRCSSEPVISNVKSNKRKMQKDTQQLFDYKLAKNSSLMRKLSCGSQKIETKMLGKQNQPTKLNRSNNSLRNMKRKVISLQSEKSDKNDKILLFFKKMVYFAKIAVVEELSEFNSQSIVQISLNCENRNKKTSKQLINIKKISNNYLNYEYYIKDVGQYELKQVFSKNSKKQSLLLLRKLAKLMLLIQQQGFHCFSFNLKNITLKGAKVYFNQPQSLFRVHSKGSYQSYDLIENLVGYWLSMESNQNVDELMRKYFLKGLEQARVNQLISWKDRIYNSQLRNQRFQYNLQFLMRQTCIAMKKDHINQFIALLKSVFKLKDSKISVLEQEQISSTLQNYDLDNDPLRNLIAKLSLIENQRYFQIKEMVYYLGHQAQEIQY